MPPGWSHTGDHKMTSVVRKEFMKAEESVFSQTGDRNY